MLISHKHKFICLNPPKTGTGYREAIISCDISVRTDPLVRHFNVCETLKYLKNKNLEEKCKDYLWFAFTRNPWIRMESWFNMSLAFDKVNGGEKCFQFDNLNSEFFLKEIQNYLKWNAQEKYLIKNEKKLDYIGKLENISEDLNFISQKLNFKLNFEPKIENKESIKKSSYGCGFSTSEIRHETIRTLWTKDSIDFVREKEKFVIDLMNYKFPKKEKWIN